MKKLIYLTFLFVAISYSSSKAQSFKNAIGLRMGSPIAVSFKHFLNGSSALEAFAGTRSYGYDYSYYYYDYSRIRYWTVGAAYHHHMPINLGFIDGLEYYFGGGVSAYFWNYGEYYYAERFSSTSFSIQGYIGMNYTFENIPLNLFIDWSPTFFVNSYLGGFRGGNGAIGARYVIN